MSTPIPRYDIYPVNYQTLKEETDPTGEWVKYDDHAAAIAALAALQQQVETLRGDKLQLRAALRPFALCYCGDELKPGEICECWNCIAHGVMRQTEFATSSDEGGE